MRADVIKKILCGLWFMILVAGLNTVMRFIDSGILILVFFFFTLVDLIFSKAGIFIKVFISLLLVHRKYYIGNFFNLRWLTWLAQDMGRDLAAISQQGLVMVQPVTAMVLTLAALIVLQTVFFIVFKRGRGITFFLCLGTALLAAAYTWQGDGSVWYTVFFVILGLILKATLPLEMKASFPLGRWLRLLLATVLVLTAVAWAMPDPGLDFSDWMGDGLVWKYDPLAPPRGKVGYSSYDGALGSALNDDDTPALRVITPVPVYLRGETRWHYTGSGWESPTLVKEDSPQLAPQHLRGEEIEITVEVLAAASLIFAPRYPVDIEVQGGSYDVYLPRDINPVYPYENYKYSAHLEEGDTYRLSVFMPEDDPEALRELTSAKADSKYYSLDNITARVYELAQTIVAGKTNSYDKAVAIASYLRYNWDYSLETEQPEPGTDFVEDFLFNRRDGYCVHFSTSFVVLARAAGLPARWVKGYSFGSREEEGTYLLRNNNAHSWAEVWFDDYGWIPFEPTPGGAHLRPDVGVPPPRNPSTNKPDPGEEQPPPDPGTSGPKTETPEGKKAVKWWPYPVIGGAVIALAVALYLVVKKRRDAIGIREVYARLQARLRIFGWQRHRWETPREHLDRVEGLPDRPKLGRFVRRFEDSVYGGAEEPPKDERQLGRGYSLVGLLIHRLTRAKGN